MMATFDPFDWETYFFGPFNRAEATALLVDEPVGSFILRASSREGGYSLSVREATEGEHQFTNYLIEKKDGEDGKTSYEMNGIQFVDIPTLLAYYKLNQLRQSCLLRPVYRPSLGRVIGLHAFKGERISDLPFDNGEVLEVIGKPEEKWWICRNALKMTGLIPTTFVKAYEDGDEISLLNPSTTNTTNSSSSSSSSSSVKRYSCNSLLSNESTLNKRSSSQQPERTLLPPPSPAWVRVIADRHPSIYDQEALVLKQGQMLYLKEIISNGMCRGENEEKRNGLFPFTYVEWTTIALSQGPWVVSSSSN